MTKVRVKWEGSKGKAKRSRAVGPSPSKEWTWLTMAGVELKAGDYLLDWSFTGETGDTVIVSAEKEAAAGWQQVCKTGPHTVPNGSDSVNSSNKKPPGYVDQLFTVP